MRARARHRLIGASALLLAVAIVVPMLLDPEPRPVSENIPIDIPSERTPFTPRLSLPPVAAADTAGTPPPDQAPAAALVKAEGSAEPRPEKHAEAKGEASVAAPAAKPDPVAEEAKPMKAEAAKADEPHKAEAAPTTAKGGKFAVQAAAPASEKAARDMADRLKKGGFTVYTEKVETKDGTRYRVRVGPYATRDDAEKARARLKSQGIAGNLIAL